MTDDRREVDSRERWPLLLAGRDKTDDRKQKLTHFGLTGDSPKCSSTLDVIANRVAQRSWK